MEVFYGTYGVSLAIWDQCYLIADTSEHTPAMQAGTRFTYPGGMEG